VAIFLQKLEIAEPVPNEVRNLAPSLLRLRLATSLAMTNGWRLCCHCEERSDVAISWAETFARGKVSVDKGT